MSLQELNQAIDSSLILFLQEDAFPTRGWVINVSSELLQSYQNLETGDYEYGKFQARYNNWVYYSSGVSGVTVPATTSITASREYIDYKNGLVSFSGTIPTTPPTATYSYHVVSVIDGFPDVDNADQYRLPLVAVDFVGMGRRPLALGGGYFVDRQYDLHVFANDDAERDQVIQVLQDSLAYQFPIMNFEATQYPLDYNGDINSSYTRNQQSTSGVRTTARVTDWSYRTIRVPDSVEKFSHRGLVTISTEVVE